MKLGTGLFFLIITIAYKYAAGLVGNNKKIYV